MIAIRIFLLVLLIPMLLHSVFSFLAAGELTGDQVKAWRFAYAGFGMLCMGGVIWSITGLMRSRT